MPYTTRVARSIGKAYFGPVNRECTKGSLAKRAFSFSIGFRYSVSVKVDKDKFDAILKTLIDTPPMKRNKPKKARRKKAVSATPRKGRA